MIISKKGQQTSSIAKNTNKNLQMIRKVKRENQINVNKKLDWELLAKCLDIIESEKNAEWH